MNKIIEKIIEPNKVYVGSTFKLKIKAIRYMTYREIQNKKYNYIDDFEYKDLKGE